MNRLSQSFIDEHNAEAKAVWEDYHRGINRRPPVFLGTNTPYLFFNDHLNPGGRIRMEEFATHARTMLDYQLRWLAWRGEHIAPYCDDPIGLPDVFQVRVDIGTHEEAAYFGAPVAYYEDQVPDARVILAGNRKRALFDAGFPDPLYGGLFKQLHETYDAMAELVAKKPTYLDRPIQILPFGHYTLGLLTLAVSLRGNEIFTDLYDDPEYINQLLDFLNQATINRIRAHREFFGLPEMDNQLFFADDSIQLISGAMLRKLILPRYKQLKAANTDNPNVKMHLCGDATRHFKTLVDELGVNEFDTGFPVDFGKLRQTLGPDVIIWGGPSVMILKDGTPDEVRAETLRVLNSGIFRGGRFVLREGNNLPPRTPFQNLEAMYQTTRAWVDRET